jgi:hypothetical protein
LNHDCVYRIISYHISYHIIRCFPVPGYFEKHRSLNHDCVYRIIPYHIIYHII